MKSLKWKRVYYWSWKTNRRN